MKLFLKFLLRLFGWLVALAVIAALVAIFAVQRVAPLDRSEADTLVRALHEGAQIERPHRKIDKGQTRGAHLLLFGKVERGEPLDADESARYRSLYRSIVGAQDAPRLRAVPHEIAETLERLRSLGSVSAPYERSKYARASYATLFDLLSSLAMIPNLPESHDPPLAAPPETKVEQLGESAFVAMSAAAHEPVNSPAYFAAIDKGLTASVDLVLEVQSLTDPRLGWFERKVAGPFGGWQSVSPLFMPRVTPRSRK
jgi:hypothetical protein